MAFLDYIFGTPAKRVEKDLFTPGQNQFLDSLTNQLETLGPMALENLGQYLTNDTDKYNQLTQPVIRDLYERIIPEIAERFTGTYGVGSFNSNAFGQQVGGQIANVGENFLSKRLEMQQNALQAIQNLLNSFGIVLQPRKGFYNIPRSPGVAENALTAFAAGLGKAVV